MDTRPLMQFLPAWASALEDWLPTLAIAVAALLAAELLMRIGRRIVLRATAGRPIAAAPARAAAPAVRVVLLLLGLSVVWSERAL